MCQYREHMQLKTKSDLIYDTVTSIERRLERMEKRIQPPPLQKEQPTQNSVAAVMVSTHTSATDKFLNWPVLSQIPDIVSLKPTFDLEYNRAPIAISAGEMPVIDNDTKTLLINCFQRNVNFWYPVLSIDIISDISLRTQFDQSSMSCLALMVLSLGAASGFVESQYNNKRGIGDHFNRGFQFFEQAYSRLPFIMMEDTHVAALCLFYFAVYMCYIRRPLQASTFLNAAVRKCQVLQVYQSLALSKQVTESLLRILWSSYIIESDIVAELSELPQSGASFMGASMPLPDEFASQADAETSKLSSFYFLACISMRRLLNRVHSLLYGDDITEARVLDIGLIMELDHQLDAWYNVLPEPLKFKKGLSVPGDDYQGFLRQRYFTCQSVIFRPIFSHVVLRAIESNPTEDLVLINYAKRCLQASYMHFANLRSYVHTIVIDTWICSLSMSTIMLLFYMAANTPGLSKYIYEELGADELDKTARNVEQLLSQWLEDFDDYNPTILQHLELMETVRKQIRKG